MTSDHLLGQTRCDGAVRRHDLVMRRHTKSAKNSTISRALCGLSLSLTCLSVGAALAADQGRYATAQVSPKYAQEARVVQTSYSPSSAYAAQDDELLVASPYAIDENDDAEVQETSSQKVDASSFPNLRPFKRVRERVLVARQLDAPNPPSIETLDPEGSTVVQVVNSAEQAKVVEADAAKTVAVDIDEFATKTDLDNLRQEAKGFTWTKGDLKITPYGFLNLAVSSDSQRAVPGEYILYVQSPDVDDSSDFAVDARTSRLGVKIEGPRIERLNATLGGAAEFDFQGVYSGSKNKGGVQLRRAYAELVDAQHERRFLAGQDWEIISSGAPQMLNYLPGAFAGNIQYRRAQVRLEQGWTCSSDLHLLGQIAICDNVLGDYTSTAGVSPASSGWPIIEGRLATELFKQSRCGLPITVAISGHIGEQYYAFSPISGVPMCSAAQKNAIRTWSTNFELDVPITQRFKFQGECYMGSNLSSFCGAINQGVDLYRREGIDDKGGWLACHYDLTDKLATNVGYGIDKPEKDDLVGVTVASNGKTTARTKNEIYFVNLLYNWSKNFMTGVEVSYWQTGYQQADVSGGTPVITQLRTAENVRTEVVARLSF